MSGDLHTSQRRQHAAWNSLNKHFRALHGRQGHLCPVTCPDCERVLARVLRSWGHAIGTVERHLDDIRCVNRYQDTFWEHRRTMGHGLHRTWCRDCNDTARDLLWSMEANRRAVNRCRNEELSAQLARQEADKVLANLNDHLGSRRHFEYTLPDPLRCGCCRRSYIALVTAYTDDVELAPGAGRDARAVLVADRDFADHMRETGHVFEADCDDCLSVVCDLLEASVANQPATDAVDPITRTIAPGFRTS